MKEFEKMLIDFCHKYGYDMVASLNDVIDYIIGYFDLSPWKIRYGK